MCTSPVKIRNHSKTYIVGVDKPYLLVPCGHCPECKKRKSNDLFIRSYFEFQYTQRVGGFAQMFTLTYNDECLPKCTSKHIPCFSRDDITKFFKILRQKICRQFSVTNSELRYTLSCEYGGFKQRPHYHIIFFVNNTNINPAQFKQFVRDSWHFGFIATTNINDGVVCSLSGLAYVAKYVSKDCDTYEFFESQKQFLKNNLMQNELEVLKKHMPFNRRSVGFGIYALSSDAKHSISVSNLKNREISIPDYKLGFRNFSLPLYYVRKCLYDSYVSSFIDDDGKKQYRTSFFLNDLGKSLQRDNVEKFIESSQRLFNNAYAQVDAKVLSYVNDKMCSCFTLQTLRDSLLSGSNFHSKDFCKFALLYSPYVTLDNEFRNEYVSFIDIDYYFTLSEDLTDMKLQKYTGSFNFGESPDTLQTLNDVLCSHLIGVIQNPYYRKFLDILHIYDFIFDYLNKHTQTKSIDCEKSALFRRYVYNY